MNRSIFGLVALTLVACISQPIHAEEFEDALVAEPPDLGPIIQQESVDVDEKL